MKINNHSPSDKCTMLPALYPSNPVTSSPSIPRHYSPDASSSPLSNWPDPEQSDLTEYLALGESGNDSKRIDEEPKRNSTPTEGSRGQRWRVG